MEGLIEVSKLGVGIIGTGRIATRHIAGYMRNINVEIRALCDTNHENLLKTRREFNLAGVAEYEDYNSLLERGDIHLVSICTPNYLHFEQSTAALNAGKHVLCEKPLCVSIDQCRCPVNAIRQCGLNLMTGQELRYPLKLQSVKRLVNLGEFGDLFFCEADYVDNKADVMQGWRKVVEKLGSWFLEAGCHPVDLMV